MARVTLADLANALEISHSTASRALANNPAIKLETRKKVQELAKQLNYEPTQRKKSVALPQPQSITLVMPVSHYGSNLQIHDFAQSLLTGVILAAREAGQDFLISHVVPSSDRDIRMFVEEQSSRGLIFLGQTPYQQQLVKIARKGYPLVAWGAVENESNPYCVIGSDNFAGGKRITSHLIRLGRRHFAFVGAGQGTEVGQRLSGFHAALAEADIPAAHACVIDSTLIYESAQRAVGQLIAAKRPYDAIVCGSDSLAIGVIRALQDLGYSVPADVAVTGYDDIRLASFTKPALTTIRQDTVQAGRLLIAKLLQQMDGAQAESEFLLGDLIVRESCGG